MKKSFLVALMFAVVAVSSAMMAPNKSEAIPAFARQVGMACSACHFQHFPKLNSFGRAFKLGGFTDVGDQELIEDDHLSLPVVLNAAFVTKVRYQKASRDTQNGQAWAANDNGTIQFPDEAALWLAGRMGEHWGAAIEKPNDAVSMKFVFSMPVAFGKAGLSVYTTDALGAAFGMELFNTSVQRSVRGFEDRRSVYAAHSTGVGSGASTGLTAFAGGDMFFAALGLQAPSATANPGVSTALNLGYNYRLNFTPQFAGFDLMIGLFGQGGKTSVQTAINTNTDFHTKFFGIDFQAQGEVAGMTLEAQAMYVDAGDNTTAGVVGTVTNTVMYAQAKSWSANVELGILPVAGLQLAYMDYNGTAVATDWRALTLGAYWEMAQNIELMINYSIKNGVARANKNELTVLFETAF